MSQFRIPNFLSMIMRLTLQSRAATLTLMIFEADQVAVVTGASSGVGKSIALALAMEGASLALVGRDLGVLQNCAPDGPGKIRCYEADITDDAELARFTAQVLADFGAVDLLVHSAGVFAMGELES